MPVARSHNRQLRKAYNSALAGIIYDGNPVPVYSEMAPDNPPSFYIIFSGINNTDNSPKSAFNFNTTIITSIYSSSPKYHNANAVDAIADIVLQRLTGPLTIDDFQVVSTEVVNDNTDQLRIMGQLVAIDRRITLRHRIFQGT